MAKMPVLRGPQLATKASSRGDACFRAAPCAQERPRSHPACSLEAGLLPRGQPQSADSAAFALALHLVAQMEYHTALILDSLLLGAGLEETDLCKEMMRMMMGTNGHKRNEHKWARMKHTHEPAKVGHT